MNIKFRNETTGAYSGQVNSVLKAYANSSLAGELFYNEYQNEILIMMIKVKPDFQRQGIGEKLVLELQKQYPRTEIEWGWKTPAGQKLHQKIKNKLYVDKQKYKQADEYKKLKKKLDELEKEMDKITSNPPLSDVDRKKLEKLDTQYKKTYIKIYQLEQDPKIRKLVFFSISKKVLQKLIIGA